MDQLPNLLIVDDYRENLLLLEILIKRLNVNIITANSGADALEKTKDVELALAIIDVRMPGMDGYELALRMNDRISDKVPVIFLTASHFSEVEMFKGYEFGAVDYIFKPIDNNFLLSKINVFLDLFNQKQTIRREAEILKNYADELIRVNRALKQSEEKYRTMLKASPDGILVIDHIRAFSRSHEDYVLSEFHVNTSIENAVSMIREQFNHLGIDLNLQLESEIPQLIGNTYKFEQAIVNLLPDY